MRINTDRKIDILLASLQERYTSIHIIRERVQNIALWIMGILLGASGWIIQSNIDICICKKTILVFFITIGFFVLIFFCFEDLKKGFNAQRSIAAKIEEELGCYNIYPNERKTPTKGNFFRNNYIILIYGFITLILSILIFT